MTSLGPHDTLALLWGRGTMMRVGFAIAMFGAATLLATNGHAQDAQCRANYQDSGSFLGGHTFKTNADVRADKAVAFKRIYRFLASQNLRINNSDEEMGVINASTDVRFSESATAPLNVIIGDTHNGVTNVAVTFSPGAHKLISKPEESLCQIVDSAAG